MIFQMQNDERTDLCVSPADEPVLEELAQQPDSSSRAKSRGRLRAWASQPHARRRAFIGTGAAAGAGLWLAPSPLKWFSSAPDIGRLCDLLSSDKRVVSFSVSGDDAIGLKIKMSDETNNSTIRELLESISALGGWRGASSSSRGKRGWGKAKWIIKRAEVILSRSLPIVEDGEGGGC